MSMPVGGRQLDVCTTDFQEIHNRLPMLCLPRHAGSVAHLKFAGMAALRCAAESPCLKDLLFPGAG